MDVYYDGFQTRLHPSSLTSLVAVRGMNLNLMNSKGANQLQVDEMRAMVGAPGIVHEVEHSRRQFSSDDKRLQVSRFLLRIN